MSQLKDSELKRIFDDKVMEFEKGGVVYHAVPLYSAVRLTRAYVDQLIDERAREILAIGKQRAIDDDVYTLGAFIEDMEVYLDQVTAILEKNKEE